MSILPPSASFSLSVSSKPKPALSPVSLNDFLSLSLSYPALAPIGERLAHNRDVFSESRERSLLVSQLLTSGYLGRYYDWILTLFRVHPETLMIRERETGLLPCDILRKRIINALSDREKQRLDRRQGQSKFNREREMKMKDSDTESLTIVPRLLAELMNLAAEPEQRHFTVCFVCVVPDSCIVCPLRR